MLEAWVAGALLALGALPAGAGEETQSVAGAEAPDKMIAALRQITGELTDSVKQFEAHLDREIALHDRGYRSADGRRIPGADADILSGPADLALPAVQKLLTARMISARRTGYEPAALIDCDRIQSLIAETRNRVVQSNNAMRQFLMISAKELNSRTEVEAKSQRGELLKARNAATEAAKKALAVLPVDLPEIDSPEDQMDRTWSLTGTALPVGKNDGTKVPDLPQPMNTRDDVVLPIRVERGKKITLIHEAFRRVTLMDSGMEDGQGRHLFYQEDWEQRQGTTSVKRWAVAVDTATGQQTLLRRYENREFSGELDEVYNSRGRVYISRAKLPETASAPSLKDMAAATLETSQSREELDDAVVSFKTRLREALARSDASLDDELPDNFRQTLFAIRGHLGRSEAILNSENEVRRAVDRAAQKADALEALAAWANGTALERETPEGDSRALLEALNRSDTEIASTRSAARDALKALPPDVSRPDAQFPAFMNDVIVRMRGTHSPAAPDGTVRCRQEVWRLEGSVKNMRRVKRTIDVVDIERKTGIQTRASREMKYYPAGPGETLEGVFDENAAQ
jgi:hypothetical protein